MNLKSLFAGAAAIVAVSALAGAAGATTYTYVGSWNVQDGPDWTTGPIAYSGQDAAALLFGGTASEYAISTQGSNAGLIDFMAIYSVFSCCQATLAQDYHYNNTDPGGNNFSGGLYFDGNFSYPYTGALSSPASAFVSDNAEGTNYAFRISGVPEPTTWALMLMGFGLTGVLLRSDRRRVVAA